MSLYFPKINQLRFHHGELYDVSEKNMDNQAPTEKYLEGITPKNWYQPILKIWPAPVGDSFELDFVIHSSSATWAAEKINCVLCKINTFDRYGEPDEIGTLGTNLSDWFLGSLDEMKAAYTILKDIATWVSGKYWTSTDTAATTAKAVDFTDGSVSSELKAEVLNVRPIRRFAGTWGLYPLGSRGPSGGYVFAHDGTNYYEAYFEDLSAQAWSNIDNSQVVTTSALLGKGPDNTAAIIAQAGHTASAAEDCDGYTSAGGSATPDAQLLSASDFYTYASNSRHVYRFGLSLGAVDTGYYIVKLVGASDHTTYPGRVFYESNIFEINTSFEGSYAFVVTNFENDFGNVWINATPTTWYLKLMLPYNMYLPKTKIKKDVYATDSGALTTLRSTINRVYEFETMPIPMWYAELIQMSCALSSIYLNDLAANFEDTPEIEPIQQSNLCVLRGDCVLTGFNDYYLLNL